MSGMAHKSPTGQYDEICYAFFTLELPTFKLKGSVKCTAAAKGTSLVANVQSGAEASKVHIKTHCSVIVKSLLQVA